MDQLGSARRETLWDEDVDSLHAMGMGPEDDEHCFKFGLGLIAQFNDFIADKSRPVLLRLRLEKRFQFARRLDENHVSQRMDVTSIAICHR